MNYQSGGTWTQNAKQTYDKTKLIVIKLVSTEHSMVSLHRRRLHAATIRHHSHRQYDTVRLCVALRESAWSTICYFEFMFFSLFILSLRRNEPHDMNTTTKRTEMYRLWICGLSRAPLYSANIFFLVNFLDASQTVDMLELRDEIEFGVGVHAARAQFPLNENSF